jgi:hypothetical protein
LENILVNNRIKWYGHVLRMNKEKIPKKILNVELKGKYQRGWEQVRKDALWRGGHRRKLGSVFGKTGDRWRDLIVRPPK